MRGLNPGLTLGFRSGNFLPSIEQGTRDNSGTAYFGLFTNLTNLTNLSKIAILIP
jgi:hypothetical protein